jgi:Fe2+ or Zn2+ uptake regulation protein
MITLEGLTSQQVRIADLLWACDTEQDIQRLMSAMPTQYKQDAETVYQLLIAAELDRVEEITDAVADYCAGL